MKQPKIDSAELLLPLMQDPEGDGGLDGAAEARMRAWLRTQVADVPLQRAKRRRSRRLLHSVWSAVGLSAAAAIGLMWFQNREGAGEQAHGSATVPAPGESADASWEVASSTGAAVTWTAENDDEVQAVQASFSLVGAGEIATGADSRVHLVARSGAKLALAPQSRLLATETGGGPDTEVTLRRGRVTVEVPPLGARGSFSVRAAETLVVVHGTRFDVALIDADSNQVCVRVAEGRVEVRNDVGQQFLEPGQALGCGPTAGDVERSREQQADARAEREKRRRAARIAQAAQTRTRRRPKQRPKQRAEQTRAQAQAQAQDDLQQGLDPAALAEQNRLLGAALAAERAQDHSRAKAMFERLLERYPSSPLAPDAQAGLLRLTAD